MSEKIIDGKKYIHDPTDGTYVREAEKPKRKVAKAKKPERAKAKNEAKTRKMPDGVRFSSENQPKKNGRKKKLATVLKELGREVSPDVEARIYEVMLEAICCKSDADAQERLKKAEKDQPEYGWIYQRVILAVKKEGLSAILEVLDRIFGKKSRVDLTSNGQTIAPVALVEFLESKDDNATGKSKSSTTK